MIAALACLALFSQTANGPQFVAPPENRSAEHVLKLSTEDPMLVALNALGKTASETFRQLKGMEGGWPDPKEVVSHTDGSKDWAFEWMTEGNKKELTWIVNPAGKIERIIAAGKTPYETEDAILGHIDEVRRYANGFPINLSFGEVLVAITQDASFEAAFKKLKFVTTPASKETFFYDEFSKLRAKGDVDTKLRGYVRDFEAEAPLKNGTAKFQLSAVADPIFIGSSVFDPEEASYSVKVGWNPNFMWWTPMIHRIDLQLKTEER